MKYLLFYIQLLSFNTLSAQVDFTYRPKDSGYYKVIEKKDCMCHQPHHFIKIVPVYKEVKDTVEIAILKFWDFASDFYYHKIVGISETNYDGNQKLIKSILKPGSTFFMRKDGYLFTDNFVFKIYNK